MAATILPFIQREHADTITKYRSIVDEIKSEYLSQSQRFPWIVGFSGGKDSTVLAQAVVEAVLETPPNQRTREIHVVANDTRVESPFVTVVLDVVLERIGSASNAMGLPISVKKTQPKVDQSFWVNLIGRGYPSPNISMRWCTDRLKIQLTLLAQKARAAGIHLVLATQRPDAKTFVGLLRSNIPSRIALTVQKSSESAIILDEAGAEDLLGAGDMLVKPNGQAMSRVHGVFLNRDFLKSLVRSRQ